MCTGRIDLSFIIRAYAKGADGVIIGGCWPGECHYVTEGNYDALSNVHLCWKLLDRIGLRRERLRIEWIAASQGSRFAQVMSDFTRQVRELGPLGRVEGIDEAALKLKLDAVNHLIPYIKVVEREKLRAPSRTEKAINAFYGSDEANRLFDDLIADKLASSQIFRLLADGPLSIREISEKLGLSSSVVAKHMKSSSNQGLVGYDQERGSYALACGRDLEIADLLGLVTAPCQLACPIGTEAWRYVAHIGRGEYEQAYFAIRESNPFPSVCARVCNHKCEQHCRLRTTGEDPVAIRALKRFVTDTTDPGVYVPPRADSAKTEKVAIVGAGPSGLTAAHLLSLRGYKVTVFDANDKPGGMLLLGIPEYRLPRKVLEREIAALIDDNVTLKMGVSLGKDITVDQLFDDGYGAVFLALGAMKSQPLRVNGETAKGVYPSIRFLAEFNLRGKSLAKGRVGVIGGGNSAIDAARIALRQEGVEQVMVIYRRTREEMPAFSDEIDAAIAEGVVLKNLLSPVSVETDNGTLSGLKVIKNELGTPDNSGRRRPVPIAGSEHVLPLDTLIVAVGEKPGIEDVCFEQSSVKTTEWGSIAVDAYTLTTSRKGLFAGGDVVTGPNTVVDAIAAGKKAAVMIDRYLAGEELLQPAESARPIRYVEPAPGRETSARTEPTKRLMVPHAPAAERRSTFAEVEQVVTEESAQREARRCLRCGFDFHREVRDAANGRGKPELEESGCDLTSDTTVRVG